MSADRRRKVAPNPKESIAQCDLIYRFSRTDNLVISYRSHFILPFFLVTILP